MKRAGILATLCGLLIACSAYAAQITPFTIVDPSQQLGNLNTIIAGVNGTPCSATGASPQTCNGTRGTVTTGTLATAAATNAAFTINNSAVAANSQIVCSVLAYSGTIVTNGYPTIMTCVPTAGVITVNITNTHAANALNGTVTIGFVVNGN